MAILASEPEGFRGGVGGSGSFVNPPTDATRIVWFDASDSSTITKTGTAVSQWNNKGSLGTNATQATGGLQPVFTTAGQNSHSTLGFNAQVMGFGTSVVLNRAQPFYLGMVINLSGIVAGNIFLALNDDTLTGNSPSISIAPTTFLFNPPLGVWSPVSCTPATVSNGVYHILELVYNGSGSNTSTNFSWYFNKTLQTTGTSGTTSSGTNNVLGGQTSSSSTNAMAGFIAEVIVSGNAALQPQYEAYFASHWAL